MLTRIRCLKTGPRRNNYYECKLYLSYITFFNVNKHLEEFCANTDCRLTSCIYAGPGFQQPIRVASATTHPCANFEYCKLVFTLIHDLLFLPISTIESRVS